MSTIERRYLEGIGDMFGPTTLTDQQKELLSDIQTLEAETKRRKRYNYSDAENKQWRDEQFYRIQEKHYVKNQKIVESIEREIGELKADWEKRAEANVNKSLLEFTKWKTRYSSMGKEALIAEAEAYLHNNSTDYTPERLDSLNEALTRAKVKSVGYSIKTPTIGGGEDSGPVEEHSFTEWIRRRKGYEPWLREKPELSRAIDLYSAPFGTMRILETDTGKIQEFEILEALEK